MSKQFPKQVNYEDLKASLENDAKANTESNLTYNATQSSNTPLTNQSESEQNAIDGIENQTGLTGTRLRSYAFAVLTRKEYSKKDLTDKLNLYAKSKDEVNILVEELARENYQSDLRVAEMTVRSQFRKGKGPHRIKMALQDKHVDHELAFDEMEEIDWYEQAYAMKVKKYGVEVSSDPKIKAKQIRFLQYRGFEMDAIIKAIKRKETD